MIECAWIPVLHGIVELWNCTELFCMELHGIVLHGIVRRYAYRGGSSTRGASSGPGGPEGGPCLASRVRPREAVRGSAAAMIQYHESSHTRGYIGLVVLVSTPACHVA